MSTCKRTHGFSLVELMVALALGLFLVGGVILMYLSGKTTASDAEALARIQENVRFNTDYLVRDLRNAGFDDVVGLTISEIAELNDPFLAISGEADDEITIRYAGRGHCAERFDEFRLVQNTYFVSENGELTCAGSTWDRDVGEFVDPKEVPLVSGLDSVVFETICQSDPPYNYETLCGTKSCVPEDQCVGLRIQLNFRSLRPMQANDGDIRSVELTAGLRNSVMKLLYDHAVSSQKMN